jgi:DNA-binding Lrp family transcriptional regulator
MMTIMMIDVEAGKEDLFERLATKFKEIQEANKFEKIEILYMARCFTHSDISVMLEVKDAEALPGFITEYILKTDGVYDLQFIPLFNPNFFKLPSYVNRKDFKHFTVTVDIRSHKTETVFKYLQEFAATEEAAISFLAYSFYSYDNDIILSLLAPSLEDANKFITNKIRSIDGVIDTLLWQIEKAQFIIPHEDWLKYINYFRMEDFVSEELWDESYICAC